MGKEKKDKKAKKEKKSKKDKKAKKEKKRGKIDATTRAEEEEDDPAAPPVVDEDDDNQQLTTKPAAGAAIIAHEDANDDEGAVEEPSTTDRVVNPEKQQDAAEEGEDADADPEETTSSNKKRRKRKRKRSGKKDDDKNDNETEQDLAAEPSTTAATMDDEKTAQLDRTVYVEGIPFAAAPDQVRQFFVDHGCADLRDVRLPVWQDSGRLRGYGHVVFESKASCARAVSELSGRYLQGRYLTIQPARQPRDCAVGGGNADGTTTTTTTTTEPSKTIMLHNLSYQAVEEDIEPVLSKYGAIADGGVRVVRHSATGQSKGFAYVEFVALESAVAVMEASSSSNSSNNNTAIVIRGRPCRLDYDHGRVRGSFRTADRRLWQKEYGRDKKKRVEE